MTRFALRAGKTLIPENPGEPHSLPAEYFRLLRLTEILCMSRRTSSSAVNDILLTQRAEIGGTFQRCMAE